MNQPQNQMGQRRHDQAGNGYYLKGIHFARVVKFSSSHIILLRVNIGLKPGKAAFRFINFEGRKVGFIVLQDSVFMIRRKFGIEKGLF